MASSVLGCSCSFDAAAVNPRHTVLLHWTNSVICLSLFPIYRLLQRHRGIWTGHLEAKGDLPQTNQVQAAINRVHKTQQSRENARYRKDWAQYLHSVPSIMGIWDCKVAHQPSSGICPQVELVSTCLSSCDIGFLLAASAAPQTFLCITEEASEWCWLQSTAGQQCLQG